LKDSDYSANLPADFAANTRRPWSGSALLLAILALQTNAGRDGYLEKMNAPTEQHGADERERPTFEHELIPGR
jgi:hypothetical protein